MTDTERELRALRWSHPRDARGEPVRHRFVALACAGRYRLRVVPAVAPGWWRWELVEQGTRSAESVLEHGQAGSAARGKARATDALRDQLDQARLRRAG